MERKEVRAMYIEYGGINELDTEDALLVGHAREAASKSYAPYSQFYVGAAVRMDDGSIISGANQENASYPVGLCAERVVLGAASSTCPHQRIEAMAIFVSSGLFKTMHPSGPCGLCRQTILEYENRFGEPIVIFLTAEEGPILRFDSIKDLLPLYFEGADIGVKRQ